MKVAISAHGNNLDTRVDPRFGRCRYFIIAETDDLSFQAFENANAELPTGAGIQSASFVASTDVGAVLTGNCGPKARDVLEAGGILVYTGQTGTIRDVIETFQQGRLTTDTPLSSDSTDTPPRALRNSRMGRCGGRKMGGGCGGRGLGGGRGAGGLSGRELPRETLSETETLEQLRYRASELKAKIESIHSRIKEMEA